MTKDNIIFIGLDTHKESTEVAYELDGERIDYFPSSSEDFARCKPIFETLPGISNHLGKQQTRGLARASYNCMTSPQHFHKSHV